MFRLDLRVLFADILGTSAIDAHCFDRTLRSQYLMQPRIVAVFCKYTTPVLRRI